MNDSELNSLIEQIRKDVCSRLIMNVGYAHAGKAYDRTELAAALEYSMLNPDTTLAQIEEAVRVAKKLKLANICVSPYYTSVAAECLRGSGVAVCVPVGFPHGAASTASKIVEIREAIKNGATELDVEMNILAAKSSRYDDVKKDMDELCNMAIGKAKLKAIYEQSLYNDEEKVQVLKIAVECGADFIKISNALTGKKASTEDVKFVRSVVGGKVGIKIDGGVRSAAIASSLLQAGANRFGVSKPEDVLADAAE